MAQDISGTSLLANSQANAPTPCVQVLIDWDDDGFGDIGSWTDESEYFVRYEDSVKALSWNRSIPALGQGVAAFCDVTLQNPECGSPYSGFRFSATNASGPLYAKISAGKMRFKRAQVLTGFEQGGSPELVPVITGYITRCVENGQAGTVELTIEDRSVVAALTKASTALMENVTGQGYLETLAALLDRDPPDAGDRDFDRGVVVHPVAWLDDESVWKEMGDVAEAHGGRVWWDRAGGLHFESWTHLVRPATNAWEDPTVSQYTFTVSRFGACDPVYNPRDVVNHVIIEAVPRYVGVLQVVFVSSEVHMVPPSGSLEVKVRHRWPVRAIVTPVEDTDFVAVTAGGTDITGDVEVAVSDLAASSTLTLTNNNADYAAFFYHLQLRGYPVLSEQAITVEVEDATSIAQWGRSTRKISNVYVQGRRHAEGLAQFLLARFKDPPLNLTLRDVPGVPWLETGDRVTVVEALTGINADFFSVEISGTYEAGLDQTYTLVKAADLYPYTDWFILGTNKFGKSGDSDAGRLMW